MESHQLDDNGCGPKEDPLTSGRTNEYLETEAQLIEGQAHMATEAFEDD